MTTYFEYYFRMPTHDPWIQQSEGKDGIDLEDEQWYAQDNIEYFKERLEHSAYLVREYTCILIV